MRGTICVVKNDPFVRLAAVMLLEGAGYHVIDFDCADRALIGLGRRAAGVFMILTEARLPGIFDGVNLAQVASISWPWITVLVALGNDSIAPDLPGNAVVLATSWDHDDVLSHAFQAERQERKPAYLDYNI